MNAEVHFNPDRKHPDDLPLANVRYSPITLASERVAQWLAALMGEAADVRQHLNFTDVEDHGSSVRVGYLEQRLSAKDEALGAAQALWAAVKDMTAAPAHRSDNPFEIDPAVVRMARLNEAMTEFEEALGVAQREDTKADVAASEIDPAVVRMARLNDDQRCTYKFRETVVIDGIRWGLPGDVCGWNPEAGIHVADDERMQRGKHVWRHEPPKER